MNGPREGERIEIADATEYIIGRDEGADIIFKDDLVSRKHVKVRRDWSGEELTAAGQLGQRHGDHYRDAIGRGGDPHPRQHIAPAGGGQPEGGGSLAGAGQ